MMVSNITTPTPKLAMIPAIKKKAPRKRDSICLIETQPKADWFVIGQDSHGRKVWFLRLQITGMLPRRLGPFRSRAVALRCLDLALNNLGDCISNIESEMDKYLLSQRFAKRWPLAMIEDEFALTAGDTPKKGA